MPLADNIPRIDDRRYDEIVTALRTRIARYTPEWIPDPVWTDVNDSDPGITLVQVFAWLAEQLTYRMSRVPELAYIKFLELLGIELKPAEPARAEITFGVNPSHPNATVIVPLRTQVTAEASDGGPPIVFETDRALVALRARLAAVLVNDGASYTPVTAENDAAAAPGFEPLGPRTPDGNGLLLGFDEPLPPGEEVDLAFWVVDDDVRLRPYQCGLPDTPAYGPARLVWEYFRTSAWQPLDVVRDDTGAFTRSAHVLLKAPATGLMTKAAMGAIPDLYWIRARVERSQYERPPVLLAVRTNTVAARQAETSRDEVLGGSNGRPNQTFRLANAPVLHDTLELRVDEGDGEQPWRRVDDFYGSKPDDHDYVLDRTSGEIRFGDGFNGAIPVANVANAAANVVARTYRFGGGRRGNVAARRLTTLPTTIVGIDEDAIYNLLPADGGREEETLDEAKKRAPRAIRSRCRAVTADDFEHLAQQAANVKRAKALPLYHPGFPDVPVPGVVTVIVVPDAGGEPNGPSHSPPRPSEGTLRTVCAYLDARRLLTTELYVIAPTYQQVEIRADVVVENTADLAAVKNAIERALLDYFHPLKGGEDGHGWPFGGTIFYSRVYQRVFAAPGVQSIERLVVVLDGAENLECRDVPIQKAALVYSVQHTVHVRYRDEEEAR